MDLYEFKAILFYRVNSGRPGLYRNTLPTPQERKVKREKKEKKKFKRWVGKKAQ